MNITQVTGDSKAARESDMENYSLQTIGAENALRELMGGRSDDIKAKSQMYEKISTEGFAMQKEIESDPSSKVTLNTVNVMFLGAGIQTDLVNKTSLLPITAEKK
jgi:DNA-directed RNA polymerase beta subunit